MWMPRAILLTTSKRLANAVAKEIERQLADLPTAAVARKAIQRNSAIVMVRSLERSRGIVSNRFAPEHLSIPDDSLLARVRHAGSVFIGPFSTGGRGRLRVGTESRAAHQRRGAHCAAACRWRII